MTPDERARLRAEHVPIDYADMPITGFKVLGQSCRFCLKWTPLIPGVEPARQYQPWPCPTIRLLDEVERLEQVIGQAYLIGFERGKGHLSLKEAADAYKALAHSEKRKE